jgi:hypothetical protein
MMRGRDEIQRVYERIGSRSELLKWRADDFRYGMLIGKIVALGWMLGEEASSDLSIDFDFEGWVRELRNLGDHVRSQLDDKGL